MVSLLGLAALAGTLAAWLTVILLVFPARQPVAGRWPLQGIVNAGATAVADFASHALLASIPGPARFFEQLGPDRFRREFYRHLRAQADSHVDDVMGRRNAAAWASFSGYARGRIYAHVQRRLPFAVDNFVENVQRDLDDIVMPRALVQQYFAEHPDVAGQVFLAAFGADLRARLPLAGLVGALAGWALSGLVGGEWQAASVAAAGALAGTVLVLSSLAFPERRVAVWPLRSQGILFRRQARFQRILAGRLANDSLSWRALTEAFLNGAQAPRVQQLMRREVTHILDGAIFKATLQLLLGPEALVQVKQSAVEKALEVLATTPVSAALQESCRIEVERSLMYAADKDAGDAYASLWAGVLSPAWKVLPLLMAGAAFALVAALTWVLPHLL